MAEERRQNIYGNYIYDLEHERKKLKYENISDRNKELIISFLNYLLTQDRSVQRCNKLSIHLRYNCRMLQKDLDKISKDELINHLMALKMDKVHAEATKTDYIVAIKQFYKWYENEDLRIYSENQIERRAILSFYKYLKEIKLKDRKKKIDPADILTDNDILEVLKFCLTFREKAFIRLLHETGARAGEFLNIKIKHIAFEENGSAKIHLDGKTGERRVPVVYSTVYLRDYIMSHPYKDNPEKLLWWGDKGSNYNQGIKHGGACKMLRIIWSRIPDNNPVKKKSHNMHFFRHSRATLLAPVLTESLLCTYMGWTLASRMVRTYVHLCPEDLDKAYLANAGIQSNTKKSIELKAKICPGCQSTNDSIAEYCFRCGKPLSLDGEIRGEELKKHQIEATFEKMFELMKNPDFIKFVKDRGLNI